MKSPSKEKIEEEEWNLQQAKGELKKLKSKFIKLPWDTRLISFLEFYVAEKEKFIHKLKDFKQEK